MNTNTFGKNPWLSKGSDQDCHVVKSTWQTSYFCVLGCFSWIGLGFFVPVYSDIFLLMTTLSVNIWLLSQMGKSSKVKEPQPQKQGLLCFKSWD